MNTSARRASSRPKVVKTKLRTRPSEKPRDAPHESFTVTPACCVRARVRSSTWQAASKTTNQKLIYLCYQLFHILPMTADFLSSVLLNVKLYGNSQARVARNYKYSFSLYKSGRKSREG